MHHLPWPAATFRVAGSRVSKARLGLLTSPSRQSSLGSNREEGKKGATHKRPHRQSTVATRIFYRVAPGNIPCHYQTSLTCTDNHCRRELLVQRDKSCPATAPGLLLDEPQQSHVTGGPFHRRLPPICLLMLTCTCLTLGSHSQSFPPRPKPSRASTQLIRVLVEERHTRHGAPTCGKGRHNALWSVREEIRVSLPDHTMLLFVWQGRNCRGRYHHGRITIAEKPIPCRESTGSFQTHPLRQCVERDDGAVRFLPRAAGQCDPALELRRRFARRGTRLH